MTVEEMCLWLEMHENPKYEAIIAALRAGQEIKGAGNALANYLDRLTFSNPPERPSYEKVLQLLVKWDAATGDGE